MIDTVCLTIKQEGFRIQEHDRFTPSTLNLFYQPYLKLGRNKVIKCVQNVMTKKGSNKYYPRLTVFKAVRKEGIEIFMHVEFSIPKLLYGNNFDEIEESDFGEVCWKLKSIMYEMGVYVEDIKTIVNADISAIHYSKNFVFINYFDPHSILRELEKINLNGKLDLNQTDFKNNGYSVKYHSNDFELTFYDKLKDLEKAKFSEKRSIEKDNYMQVSLLDMLEPRKPFAVLRMELRYGSPKRIKTILKKVSMDGMPNTFVNLFSSEVAFRILYLSLEEVHNNYPAILYTDEMGFGDLFTQMRFHDPQAPLKKLIMMLGLKAVIDEAGIRGFRELAKSYGSKQWYRLKKDMDNMFSPYRKNAFFDELYSQLREFKMVRMDEYDVFKDSYTWNGKK